MERLTISLTPSMFLKKTNKQKKKIPLLVDENSHITHPKGLGLCVSKECNWQRLFFLLFGMASIMLFNLDLF